MLNMMELSGKPCLPRSTGALTLPPVIQAWTEVYLTLPPVVRIEIHEMKSRYRTAYVTLRQIELAALGAPVEKRIITSKYPPAL